MILDDKYEENSFIIENSTLTGDGNELNPTKLLNMQQLPFYYMPAYAACEAGNGLRIPNTSDTPFKMVPEIKNLFGFHIYDKRFGFYNLYTVNPVSNYPYFGDDTSLVGKFFDYNGIVSGYITNGVSSEDVKTEIGTKKVDLCTLNDDTMENPLTKRIIYTDKEDSANLTYGRFCREEIYYYVPYVSTASVHVQPGMNPDSEFGNVNSTGNIVINTPVSYAYVKCEDCIFYKNKKFVTSNSSNATFTYYMKVSIEPDEITSSGEYYVSVKDSSNGYGIVKLDSVSGGHKVYGDGGMVKYMKDGMNTYHELYGNLSEYQYIETTLDSEVLVASDGYGDNPEVYPTIYNSIPYCEIITENNSKTLKINADDFNEFDKVCVFSDKYEITVMCEEDSLIKKGTVNQFFNTNLIRWLIYMVNAEYRLSVKTKIINYKSGENDEINIAVKSFTVPLDIYKVWIDSSICLGIGNYNTGETITTGINEMSVIKIVTGLTGENIKYTKEYPSDGNVKIYAIYRYENDQSYSLVNVGDKIDLGGKQYLFDGEWLFEIYKKSTRRMVNRQSDGGLVVQLYCGANIPINTVEASSTDGQTGTTGIDNRTSGYKCSYRLTQLNDIQAAGRYLPYPHENDTAIFKLVGDNWNYMNEIQQNTFDSEYMYYDLSGVQNSDYLFIVGINGDINDPYSVKYINYTPKICLEELKKILWYDGKIYLYGGINIMKYPFTLELYSDSGLGSELVSKTYYTPDDLVEYDTGKYGYEYPVGETSIVVDYEAVIDITGTKYII